MWTPFQPVYLFLLAVMQSPECFLPYGKQTISDDDVVAVVEACSPFLTQGPAVNAFEQALVDRVGADHAVAVNSATSALHLACLALEQDSGIGYGPLLSLLLLRQIVVVTVVPMFPAIFIRAGLMSEGAC